MPKIVITHAVKDVERWLKGKEERVTMFGQFGTNVTDHVAMDGSNNVAIGVPRDARRVLSPPMCTTWREPRR